jgi:hypothetical protein
MYYQNHRRDLQNETIDRFLAFFIVVASIQIYPRF